MNELVFIRNGQAFIDNLTLVEVTGIDLKHFESVEYDYESLLDCASRLSFSVYELGLENVLVTIEIARYMRLLNQKENYPSTHFLEYAVSNLVMGNWLNSIPRERDLLEKFKVEVEDLIPNSKLVKVKNHPKHQPDSWLMIDGILTPVEIKIDVFNEKALGQLRRYMDHYNTESGLAVAPKLTCELPENIEFLMLKP